MEENKTDTPKTIVDKIFELIRLIISLEWKKMFTILVFLLLGWVSYLLFEYEIIVPKESKSMEKVTNSDL